MAVKMDDFIDKLYGKSPQDPNTITINPETFYNLKDIFNFFRYLY